MILDKDLSGKIPLEYLLKLQAIYPSLKKIEHRAADFILENPDFLIDASISEAANMAGCSEPTFVRLAKKMGFEGYADLKMSIRQMSKVDRYEKREYSDITAQFTTEEITKKVFDSCIDGINDTYKLLDLKTIETAVDLLNKAGRVLFVGIGDSSQVAELAKFKFLRIGIQSYSTSDVDEMLVILSKLNENDLVIPISHSGQTAPIVQVAKIAKVMKIPTIGITNFPFSSLGRNCDFQLLTSAFQESLCGEVMAKRVAQLAIIESLYVNVLLKNPEREVELNKSNRSISMNKI